MKSPAIADPVVGSAARGFWWIAGLLLVNTALFYSGSNSSFLVGLGMTTVTAIVFDASMALAFGIIAIIIGFYFLMGLYAQRGAAWAFYLGTGLSVVDALVYVKLQDWISVAFHAHAIFCIVRGLMHLREINSLPVAANDGV